MTQSQNEIRQMYPVAEETYRYRLEELEGSFTFELEGETTLGLPSAITLSIESHLLPSPSGGGLGWGEGLCRAASGRAYPFAWAWVGPELHLWLDGDLFVFQRADPATGPGRRRGGATTSEASGDILAPMPGAVLEVLVSDGDRVERNQTVVVMESMKMELLITASRDGVVRRVAVQPGQQVERGMRLLELAPESVAGE